MILISSVLIFKASILGENKRKNIIGKIPQKRIFYPIPLFKKLFTASSFD